MKIKGRVLRDGGTLSGLQRGLMAAEHRPSSALIWMSTRRLVLCLPASLCALPPDAVCQRIALAARWPPPTVPRSLINILRWRPISRNAAGRTNGVSLSRRPLAAYRLRTEKFGAAFGETMRKQNVNCSSQNTKRRRRRWNNTAQHKHKLIHTKGCFVCFALFFLGHRLSSRKGLERGSKTRLSVTTRFV